MNLALDVRSILSIAINANLDISSIMKDVFSNVQKDTIMIIQLKHAESAMLIAKYVQDLANVQSASIVVSARSMVCVIIVVELIA